MPAGPPASKCTRSRVEARRRLFIGETGATKADVDRLRAGAPNIADCPPRGQPTAPLS